MNKLEKIFYWLLAIFIIYLIIELIRRGDWPNYGPNSHLLTHISRSESGEK